MNIVPFAFEGNPIRVIEIEGEPWFVAVDVCDILDIANPSQAVGRLDEDEVTLCKTEGSHRPTNIISESGLFALILRSNKQEAKPFRKWVTSEVIPSIRKTGSYSVEQQPVTNLSHAREARFQRKMFLAMGKEMGLKGNQLLISVNQAVQKAVGIDHMGAMGVTHLEAPDSSELLNPSDIGLDFDCSAQVINMRLISGGYQTAKRNKKGSLYYEPTELGLESGAVMLDTGKRHRDGTSVRQLKWGSGIVDVLKSKEGGVA